MLKSRTISECRVRFPATQLRDTTLASIHDREHQADSDAGESGHKHIYPGTPSLDAFDVWVPSVIYDAWIGGPVSRCLTVESLDDTPEPKVSKSSHQFRSFDLLILSF